MVPASTILLKRFIALSTLLSLLFGCQISSPSIVSPEGLQVYIPEVLSPNVQVVDCDSLPGYYCYRDTLNDLNLILQYTEIKDEKYWEQFFSLEYQLQLKEQLFCSFPDRISIYDHHITPNEFVVWGHQVSLDIDRLYEPQEQFFYYEYICPTYRFRCEIGTSYKNLGKYNLKDWADQFKDIRHEIVR